MAIHIVHGLECSAESGNQLPVDWLPQEVTVGAVVRWQLGPRNVHTVLDIPSHNAPQTNQTTVVHLEGKLVAAVATMLERRVTRVSSIVKVQAYEPTVVSEAPPLVSANTRSQPTVMVCRRSAWRGGLGIVVTTVPCPSAVEARKYVQHVQLRGPASYSRDHRSRTVSAGAPCRSPTAVVGISFRAGAGYLSALLEQALLKRAIWRLLLCAKRVRVDQANERHAGNHRRSRYHSPHHRPKDHRN